MDFKNIKFGIDDRIKWILDLNSNIVSELGLKLIFVKFLPAAPSLIPTLCPKRQKTHIKINKKSDSDLAK